MNWPWNDANVSVGTSAKASTERVGPAYRVFAARWRSYSFSGERWCKDWFITDQNKSFVSGEWWRNMIPIILNKHFDATGFFIFAEAMACCNHQEEFRQSQRIYASTKATEAERHSKAAAKQPVLETKEVKNHLNPKCQDSNCWNQSKHNLRTNHKIISSKLQLLWILCVRTFVNLPFLCTKRTPRCRRTIRPWQLFPSKAFGRRRGKKSSTRSLSEETWRNWSFEP